MALQRNVYEWPREWYKFTSTEFALRTVAMRSTSVLSPRRNTRFTYQIWTVQAAFKTEVGPSKWGPKGAFFARLDGEVNLFRFYDVLRCQPTFNRGKRLPQQPFSDDTFFTDGTGWLNDGLVPPTCEVAASATEGATDIVLRGLPSLTDMVLSPGDLIELRPNGIPTTTSNLYEVVRGSGSDTSGECGVEVRPRLRQSFAPGDMAVLHYAQGVFQLADSEAGRIFRDSNVGAFGFGGQEFTG